MNHQLTAAESALQKMLNWCDKGHAWQPTIMIGSVQYSRCTSLAACGSGVRKMRSKPLIGFCQLRHHFRTPETEQEVL